MEVELGQGSLDHVRGHPLGNLEVAGADRDVVEGDDAGQAVIFDDRQAAGVAVVEWADRLGDRLPAERLELTIVPAADGSDTRRMSWTAIGTAHLRLAAQALGSP